MNQLTISTASSVTQHVTIFLKIGCDDMDSVELDQNRFFFLFLFLSLGIFMLLNNSLFIHWLPSPFHDKHKNVCINLLACLIGWFVLISTITEVLQTNHESMFCHMVHGIWYGAAYCDMSLSALHVHPWSVISGLLTDISLMGRNYTCTLILYINILQLCLLNCIFLKLSSDSCIFRNAYLNHLSA
jgi:hypothetical protein